MPLHNVAAVGTAAAEVVEAATVAEVGAVVAALARVAVAEVVPG
jgi:hypothetical protein